MTVSDRPSTHSDPVSAPAGFALLVADVRRLSKLAAKLGVVVALLCHLAPPDYRPVCETIASICGAGDTRHDP